MLRHIDGKVDLSVPLYVQPDVLGMKIALALASIMARSGFLWHLIPVFPLPGRWPFCSQQSWESRPLPETTLAGSQVQDGDISEFQAATHSLRRSDPHSYRGTGGFVPDQMRTFGRAFDMWFSTVRDWVCAWSGQLRHREFDHEESRIQRDYQGRR